MQHELAARGRALVVTIETLTPNSWVAPALPSLADALGSGEGVKLPATLALLHGPILGSAHQRERKRRLDAGVAFNLVAADVTDQLA